MLIITIILIILIIYNVTKYDSSGFPVFGMKFMSRPDNGKLVYARGRIFLIFAH